jgi:hypothetical protein
MIRHAFSVCKLHERCAGRGADRLRAAPTTTFRCAAISCWPDCGPRSARRCRRQLQHERTQQTITYGDSALKNEMCIYVARFFSSPNGDDLECETPNASATARVTKNVAGQ